MKARSPSSPVQKSCPAGVLTAARLAGPCLQPLLGTSTGSTIQKQPRLQTHLNSHLLRPSIPSVDPATLTRTGKSCPVFPGCRHPYSSVPFLLPCGIKKVYRVIVGKGWVACLDLPPGAPVVWINAPEHSSASQHQIQAAAHPPGMFPPHPSFHSTTSRETVQAVCMQQVSQLCVHSPDNLVKS